MLLIDEHLKLCLAVCSNTHLGLSGNIQYSKEGTVNSSLQPNLGFELSRINKYDSCLQLIVKKKSMQWLFPCVVVVKLSITSVPLDI